MCPLMPAFLIPTKYITIYGVTCRIINVAHNTWCRVIRIMFPIVKSYEILKCNQFATYFFLK